MKHLKFSNSLKPIKKMKATLLTLIALTISLCSFGQSPEAFKYQAVVRNSGGTIITNQAVGYQLSILQGSPSGTSVYTETFNPTTNAYGLVNLEIGTGVTTDDFSLIDWANGPYYIETSIDINGGTNYIVMGASQLVSVPYALHAKTAEAITGGISETDPIFGASVASGITGSDTTYWNNKLDIEVDGSITNEIQALSISNDTVYLSDGGFVKLPAGFDGQYSSLTGTPTNVGTFTNDVGYLTSFTEVDGDTTNELQTLSKIGLNISLSNGGGTIIDSVLTENDVDNMVANNGYLTSFTEIDGDTTNELQSLSLSGNNLSISKGNSVNLSAVLGIEYRAGTAVLPSGANSSVSITFSSPLPNSNYSVSVTKLLNCAGTNYQETYITAKTVNGFTINNEYVMYCTGGMPVDWIVLPYK
ncbi:MAG: hypothetical protein RQ875_13200 [Vicingaceae bacterium]|nr:hypothetical protein [Vicingaceae bacterium]